MLEGSSGKSSLEEELSEGAIFTWFTPHSRQQEKIQELGSEEIVQDKSFISEGSGINQGHVN